MKKQFFLVLLLAVFSVVLAEQNASAQEGISVYSTVNYNANNNRVMGHSYTYATYGNSGYYNTEVTSFLVDSDYNLLASNTAYGNLQASILLAATGRGCDRYRILSSHRTTTQYYVTAFPYSGGYRDGYYDVFDYLLSSDQGQIADYVSSMFFSALTNPRVLDQPVINLGSTEHTSIGNCDPNVFKPTISNITPNRGLIGKTVEIEIQGTRFGEDAENVEINAAGEGVSFLSIQTISDTKIKVSIVIAADAAEGNRSITVSVDGLESNGKDFFVQVPKKIKVSSLKDTVVIDPGPGNILNPFGEILRENRCGAYRNVIYILTDKDGYKIIETDLPVEESFENVNKTGNVPDPEAENTKTVDGKFGDTQAFFDMHPNCPGSFTFSAKQKFKVKVGSREFTLDSVVNLSASRGKGGYNIEIGAPSP